MLLPIKPIDFELTAQSVDALEVPSKYAAARVLVRWHGIPVGTVPAPVVHGRVCPERLRAGLTRDLVRAFAQEYAARTLAVGSSQEGINLSSAPPASRVVDGAKVSVIICTRDRPADLARCLTAIARLSPPPAEVIVVDNAPRTEATAELVQTQYPQFTYLREPTPGLDHARNCGIRAAQGEIVAFTDDDVIVDRGWIGALAHAFAADPSVGLITGLIEPFELETEAQVLFETYGGFGRGYRRQYLQSWPGGSLSWSLIGAGQLGAGANMAMRRRIFDDIGLFDPALDVGTPTRGGGDHEIFHRFLKSGWVCLYEPAALVRHRHRRTLEELRRLLYDYGHATRCYFERVALNFPEDTGGVKTLSRWWWRHWALKRWWRAWKQPGWFPADFVTAEIKGFLAGRQGYQRARQGIVADESRRPDAFRVPAHDHAELQRGTDFVTIDVAQPLRDLPEGRQHTLLEVVVQHHGRSLGSVRLAPMGLPISARRLGDEIARSLWLNLLQPVPGDETSGLAALAVQLDHHLKPLTPPTPARTPLASATIIVATCDRPEDLRRCLRSLAALETNRPVQTIVVDNRPASGRAAEVVQEFPNVELVTEARPGSSYARNAGIAAARGDITVMTDDDMEVAPDWLERLVEPFARADVLAVTGNTLPARVETAAEKHFETYGGFARGFVRCEYNTQFFQRYRRRAVPTWRIGGSGNSAYRTEIFRRPEIGVFDERLGSGVPTGVGEDTKLFYDILHAGYTIIYEPAAVAWHHHRVTMPALRRQLYGYSKGHVAYHLVTWLQHGDKRALARILVELPLDYVKRITRKLRRQYAYPWRLLLTEIAGTLAGPWSLWAAHRNARRLGPGARPGPPPPHRGSPAAHHLVSPARLGGRPMTTAALTASSLHRRRWRHSLDVIGVLVARDLKVLYKRSFLGFGWALAQPILQLLIFMFVFRRVFAIQIENFASFALTGVLVWSWFQVSLIQSTGLITANRTLVRQPNFPLALLPHVTIGVRLFHFALAMPLLMGLLWWQGLSPGWTWIALPLLVIVQFVLTAGLAYPLAALNVRLRDTQHVVSVTLQLSMYLTPIFYSLQHVPEHLQPVMYLNPMVAIIEGWRDVLLRGQWPNFQHLAVLGSIAVVLLLVGRRLFVAQSHRFIEEL